MKEYKVGDYLMHETAGVCKVTAIEERALQGKGSEKLYYLLDPVFQTGSNVITPVDGAKQRVRDVSSKDEIEEILGHADDLAIIDEKNDRVRQEKFKEEMALFSPEPLASVVKTVYVRKQMRIAQGKKVMSQDEKVLQVAGKKLFEEMAFSLNEQYADVQSEFFDRLTPSMESYIHRVANC